MKKKRFVIELIVQEDPVRPDIMTDSVPTNEELEQHLAGVLGYCEHRVAGKQFIIDADTITVLGSRDHA